MMTCECPLASIRSHTLLPHGYAVMRVGYRSRGETKRVLDDYKGALADFDRADTIQPNDALTLK